MYRDDVISKSGSFHASVDRERVHRAPDFMHPSLRWLAGFLLAGFVVTPRLKKPFASETIDVCLTSELFLFISLGDADVF